MFDTSILSENIGDFIIMDSVNKEMSSAITDKQMVTIATHDYPTKRGRRQLKEASYSLVGGTNLLNSHLTKRKPWKLRWGSSLFLDKAILVGVGWVDYETKPDRISSIAWKKILHSDYIHSVRDEYSEAMLKSAGINNVINTACATMWGLTESHCSDIPKSKSKSVIFTLTDYRIDIEADKKLISLLLKNYENIYFWPQGARDLQYIKDLNIDLSQIKIVPPSLNEFDRVLNSDELQVDYVGTRLHAGIRALQKKRRTIIIGVDNRANEKSKSFNLKVCDRHNSEDIEESIRTQLKTHIILPVENIAIFKDQFKS